MAKTVTVSYAEYEWLKQEHQALSLQVMELGGRNAELEREKAVLEAKVASLKALCDSREKIIDGLEEDYNAETD